RARVPARVARRDASGRGQPLGAQPARRARSRRPRGHRAGRDAEWQPFSARDARAVLPEPRPARLLLVPARAPPAAPGALRHRGNGDMSIGGPDMAPQTPPRPGAPGEPEVPLDLSAWLPTQRWFAGKARRISGAVCRDRIRIAAGTLYVVFVGFADGGELERYLVALLAGERAVDAFDDVTFGRALLDVVRHGAEVNGERGLLVGRPGRAFPADLASDVAVRRLEGEQSNTSVIVGDRLIMKVFRHLSDGLNPDLEITRFLTEHTTFRGTPRLAGALEYYAGDAGAPETPRDVPGIATLAVLQEYVPGARDGWRWVLDRLASGNAALDALRRLGTRTAELHTALATPTPDPAFGADPITRADVAAWAESVRRQVAAAREAAHGRSLPDVPDVGGPPGLGGLVGCVKTRHHGDFHLGQTLAVDDRRDFTIIDFEGEPLRSLQEARPCDRGKRGGANIRHCAPWRGCSDRSVTRPPAPASPRPNAGAGKPTREPRTSRRIEPQPRARASCRNPTTHSRERWRCSRWRRRLTRSCTRRTTVPTGSIFRSGASSARRLRSVARPGLREHHVDGRPRLLVEHDHQTVFVVERVTTGLLADTGRPAPAGQNRLASEDTGVRLEPERAHDVFFKSARLQQAEVDDHSAHARGRFGSFVDPRR